MNTPYDMVLMKDGYNALAGPQDRKRALPLAGLAVKDSLLKEKPASIKRALRAVLKRTDSSSTTNKKPPV